MILRYSVQLVGPFLLVHFQIKQSLVVGSPLDGSVAFQIGIVVDNLAGGNIFDKEFCHLVSGEIHRVGHKFALSLGVGRRGLDLDRPRRTIGSTLGQLVDVEIGNLPRQDGGVGRPVPGRIYPSAK